MGHRSWLVRTVTLVAALGLAVGACGDDDDDGETAAPETTAASGGSASTTTGDEPHRGGTLRAIHWLEAPRGLDPVQFQSMSAPSGDGQRAFAIFDVLAMVDSTTLDVKARLAESFTSTDATTWTIKLRPNVRFSDGTPFNAEAVKFNWERHADPANRSTALAVAQEIASMEVVDELTLRVTLKSPNGQFPRIVATRLAPIGSPTALRADPQGFATKPVGAGPFHPQGVGPRQSDDPDAQSELLGRSPPVRR